MLSSSPMYNGILRLKRWGFEPSAILDIGAHNGAWTRGVRGIYPNAYVLMLDALREKELPLSITSRDLGNCDYGITLLGKQPADQVPFFVVHAGEDNSGSSVYAENTNHQKEERLVTQVTLDAMVAENGRDFEFIKLDVQGAEVDVLTGGQKCLQKTSAILMEIATVEYNNGAPLAADVLYAMKQFGFILYDILDQHRADGTETLRQFDAIFIRPGSSFRH